MARGGIKNIVRFEAYSAVSSKILFLVVIVNALGLETTYWRLKISVVYPLVFMQRRGLLVFFIPTRRLKRTG
jgi:hypothetical protein